MNTQELRNYLSTIESELAEVARQVRWLVAVENKKRAAKGKPTCPERPKRPAMSFAPETGDQR